ncbi:MAG TPA: hypothetical protein VFH68_08230 [Polyangia bacterium]|jgi:hypothetical protein|nr:hypothetical protein [Polyangia bacterium]
MAGRKSKTAPRGRPVGSRRATGKATAAVPVSVAATSPAILTSASGYQIRAIAEVGHELVTVTAPDGRLCLSIALGADGPVVEVRAQSLRFASQGLLRLDCDRLEVNAARETVLRTGALTQEVAGEVRTRAGGAVDVEAHSHRLRSRLGDIQLCANDDVSLDGERVLLNSPRPATPVPPEAAASRAPARSTPLFGLPGARRR